MNFLQRWIVWLPVAVAFGIVTTVAGFGLDAMVSSPTSLVFVLIMLLIGMVQGLVVGLIAVLATKLADRATAGPSPSLGSLAKIGASAIAAGGAVAVAVSLYMSISPPRADHPSIIGPVIVIALVAAISAAISAWRRPTQSDSPKGRSA